MLSCRRKGVALLSFITFTPRQHLAVEARPLTILAKLKPVVVSRMTKGWWESSDNTTGLGENKHEMANTNNGNSVDNSHNMQCYISILYVYK